MSDFGAGMSVPHDHALLDLMNATWPPQRRERVGPWVIRCDRSDSKRTRAAMVAHGASPAETPAETLAETVADIALAEAAMDAHAQPRLFQVFSGQRALDDALEARGYVIDDPSDVYVARVDAIDRGGDVDAVTSAWPPSREQLAIWLDGAITPERVAIMDRVTAPKTSFLATRSAEVAGCGFIAQHRDLAMLHAVEIAPKHRRQGLATQIMGSSIHWCKRHGVEWIALIARRDNEAANRLYQAIGMRVAMQYHYRIQIRASHTGAIGT